MKRNIYIVGLILVLTLVMGVTGCTISNPSGSIGTSSQATGIWVTGMGKVSVVPDIAILSLGVDAEADTVAEAQATASTAMDAVMQALADSDIAAKDITTRYFSISRPGATILPPVKKKVTGYRVSNTVTVKIRDVDKVGDIIDAAAAAGGNYIIVSNISFMVEDPAEAQQEARSKALDDAADKAREIADREDLELGEPTFISEAGNNSPTYYMSAAVPAAVLGLSTSISSGETEITVYMQVAYDIK